MTDLYYGRYAGQHGPLRTFTVPCCNAARHFGLSLRSQNLGPGELTFCGTFLPFDQVG